MVTDDVTRPSIATPRMAERPATAPDRSTTRPRTPPQISPDQLTIAPANEATWADLQTLFGSRGDPARCWCQRFRMSPGESWASEGPDELATRLREQTACGQPEAATTTGLVGLRRRQAGRLVCRRPSTRSSAPAAQQPRALGRPRRGQVRQHGVGVDVLPDPSPDMVAAVSVTHSPRLPSTLPGHAAPERSRATPISSRAVTSAPARPSLERVSSKYTSRRSGKSSCGWTSQPDSTDRPVHNRNVSGT